MSLRRATVDDLPTVLELERASIPEPWTQEHFEKELEKEFSHFMVLTDDDTDSQLLGYVVFWVMDGEAQLLNLVVADEHRRRGYGQLLGRAVVNEAIRQDAKKVVLDVRVSNDAAVQLYQRLNFYIAFIRKKFYKNGESSYLMQLDLSGAQPIDL